VGDTEHVGDAGYAPVVETTAADAPAPAAEAEAQPNPQL
jgi:hypothetical protein